MQVKKTFTHPVNTVFHLDRVSSGFSVFGRDDSVQANCRRSVVAAPSPPKSS